MSSGREEIGVCTSSGAPAGERSTRARSEASPDGNAYGGARTTQVRRERERVTMNMNRFLTACLVLVCSVCAVETSSYDVMTEDADEASFAVGEAPLYNGYPVSGLSGDTDAITAPW